MTIVTAKRYEDMSLAELRDELARADFILSRGPALFDRAFDEARVQRDLCAAEIARRQASGRAA